VPRRCRRPSPGSNGSGSCSGPRGITLTPDGTAAVQAASVLDAERLRGLLVRLSASQRQKVVAGLRLLAEAATQPEKQENDS